MNSDTLLARCRGPVTVTQLLGEGLDLRFYENGETLRTISSHATSSWAERVIDVLGNPGAYTKADIKEKTQDALSLGASVRVREGKDLFHMDEGMSLEYTIGKRVADLSFHRCEHFSDIEEILHDNLSIPYDARWKTQIVQIR